MLTCLPFHLLSGFATATTPTSKSRFPPQVCPPSNSILPQQLTSLVPRRVDLSFRRTSSLQVILYFSLRVPEKDRDQIRAAYLCQSLSLINDCDDVEDVGESVDSLPPSSLNVGAHSVCIDHVGFRLQGTFHDDPTTRMMPAFLFFPPLPIKRINGMHCVQYRLPGSLFYWSLDRTGKHRIAEADWEKYNIPKLELRSFTGSRWYSYHYSVVRDVLSSRNYDSDGRQYARDHSHPELIRGE